MARKEKKTKTVKDKKGKDKTHRKNLYISQNTQTHTCTKIREQSAVMPRFTWVISTTLEEVAGRIGWRDTHALTQEPAKAGHRADSRSTHSPKGLYDKRNEVHINSLTGIHGAAITQGRALLVWEAAHALHLGQHF